jgi:hypothetical protein
MSSRFVRRSLPAIALVPLLLAGSAVPAAAATNTLTVTAVNRSGAKVALNAIAVRLDSSQRYSIRTGKAKKLPKGNYAVLVSIPGGGTTTLGGKTVKVAGAAKLTVDARHGRQVRLGLSPAPAGLTGTVSARVCTKGSATYDVEAQGYAGGTVHVIPTASKKIAFAALGAWTHQSSDPDSYAVLYQTASGVPSNPVRNYSVAKLGTVNVDARRGPSISNWYDVAVQPIGNGCGLNLYAGMVNHDQPASYRLRLSPGKWDIRAGTSGVTKSGESWVLGSWFAPRQVAAGKTIGIRYFGASWGPGTTLPLVLNGRVWFTMDGMFVDPAHGSGGEGGDKVVATLTYRGKVVKTKRDRGWEPEMTALVYNTKKAGWYTLSAEASRYYPEITAAPGMLSPRTAVKYRFYAKPKTYALAQVFSVQMVPAGLSRYNTAKAGSTTNVALKLTRAKHDPDAKRGANPKLKSVTAQVSQDNGRTWRSTTVRKINGVWTAIVKNPSSGGVTLRARATYTTGGYSESTIVRAYAIG